MNNQEKILWGILIVVTGLGIYWAFTNPQFFTEQFNKEDGFVEYGTVVVLLVCAIVSFWRWKSLKLGWKFTLVTWAIIAATIFVAGEEISWGQRILDLETTEYFKENNDQEELNFHNLKIGDIKINKLIFGLGLTIALLLYMVILPFVYTRWTWAGKLIDQWGVPVPQIRHGIGYLIDAGDPGQPACREELGAIGAGHGNDLSYGFNVPSKPETLPASVIVCDINVKLLRQLFNFRLVKKVRSEYCCFSDI